MVSQILKGYLGFIKKITTILLYLSAAVAASVAVVLPFWALASKKPGLFSFVAVLLFLALIGALIGIRISSAERLRKRNNKTAWFGRAMLAVGRIVFLIAGLYVLTLFFMRGLAAIAIPCLIVYLFILGYGFYAKKNSHKAAR